MGSSGWYAQQRIRFCGLTSTLETAEKAFQIERAQAAAQRVISVQIGSTSGRGSRGGRGNRGGSRGRGRRGRGGGARPRGGEANGSKEAREDSAAEVGEKRKRAVEPDGGPDTKGQGVPVIQTSKKAKTDAKETGDGPS
jgi:lupus La protein